MRNKLIYIVLLLFPLVVNYFLFEFSSELLGGLFLLFYICFYRPFIDSSRLFEIGEITEDEFQSWLIPFAKPFWYPVTHFRALFF